MQPTEPGTSRRGARIFGRLVKFVVLPLIAILILWMVGGRWYARVLLERELEAWASSSVGALEDVPKRFPHTSDNASALRLEALAKPLGIELAPRTAPKDRQPTQAQIDGNSAALTALRDYLRMASSSPSAQIDPPSPEIQGFMQTHASDVDALRQHLLTAEMPQWEVDDVERKFLAPSAPTPNLVGAIKVQRVLLIDALLEERSGNRAEAWLSLQAAWSLAKSNWRRPDQISQVVALTMASIVDVASRRLSPPVPAWHAEIRTLNPVRLLTQSLKADAYRLTLPGFTRALLLDGEGEDDWPIKRIFLPLREPYLQLYVPEALEFYRNFIASVEGTPFCEQDDAKRPVKFLEEKMMLLDLDENPSWRRGVLVMVVIPLRSVNWLSSWERLVVFKTGTELTEKVLAAKTLRSQSEEKRWPSEIPSIEKSACPGRKWVYTVRDGSSITIRPSVPIPTPNAPALHYEDLPVPVLP